MIFNFPLFPGKTNAKNAKTLFLTYLPIFAQKIFLEILFLQFFFHSKYHCANFFEKKTDKRIPSNTGLRQTDKETDKHEFIGPIWLMLEVEKNYTKSKTKSKEKCQSQYSNKSSTMAGIIWNRQNLFVVLRQSWKERSKIRQVLTHIGDSKKEKVNRNNLKKITQLIRKTNAQSNMQIPQLHVKKIIFRVCWIVM